MIQRKQAFWNAAVETEAIMIRVQQYSDRCQGGDSIVLRENVSCSWVKILAH